MSVEPSRAPSIAARLLDWYDRHARALPWRVPPHTTQRPDPYRVWLSEVMLQQTTVAAVGPRFEAFIARWPTVEALAAAPVEAVMQQWAGLGYYARARNLHACAKAVAAASGAFPQTEAELRALPGLGAYTAAAVAAIAFDQPATVVDANVERVVARLDAIETPLPHARPAIRRAAELLTPATRPGDFAQAMMDLGATVCTARRPQCLICPLRTDCVAHARGLADSLPRKQPKAVRPQRHGWAYWIERDAHVLLVRRPTKGLLGGMPGLPGSDWLAALPPPDARARDLGVIVRHVFTHFALELRIAALPPDATDAFVDTGSIVAIDALDEAGLPTLYVKAVKAVLQQARTFRTMEAR